ncbi:MAG TPA: IS5 family transposase [Alphaproteobacteria bacterium]|nr:IS5 family transposase [Alphaproteobacteria bacterium]
MSDKKYRVRNWKEYNKSLVQRGSITLWVSEEILEEWRSPVKTGKRGRPKEYPDAVILCALHLKSIYHLPFRATEGFLGSIIKLFGLDLGIPDYTTLSIRQKKLEVPLSQQPRQGESLHLLIDSTGLKVFGEGEWKVRQHGYVKKRLWRKLHLAINSQTQMIEACELTELGVQDCEGFGLLLDAIEDPIEEVIGDGAYDRFRCYEEIEKRKAKGIFPPQHNAVTSQERSANKKKASPGAVAKRDEAIRNIRSLGRTEWKQLIGYHRRSLAETGMFRVKTVLGRQLSCRSVENQAIEIRVWCSIINKITLLGMPKTVPV